MRVKNCRIDGYFAPSPGRISKSYFREKSTQDRMNLHTASARTGHAARRFRSAEDLFSKISNCRNSVGTITVYRHLCKFENKIKMLGEGTDPVDADAVNHPDLSPTSLCRVGVSGNFSFFFFFRHRIRSGNQ